MKNQNNSESQSAAIPCSPFFVFDVESIGLHGEGFAVAGGIYDANGNPLHEFAYHCHPSVAKGEWKDREWVTENVTISIASVKQELPRQVRQAFWNEWMKAKEQKATMFVECGWPVEAAFLIQCIKDDPSRNWEGPYPMHEIASVMLAAGMNPMATYDRLPNELPVHEPIADSRQSARLLVTALKSLENAVRFRKTPREGGTTNCHLCGKEIPQSGLCAQCWHKRFMKSRETNDQIHP